jgi:hypothetical protein
MKMKKKTILFIAPALALGLALCFLFAACSTADPGQDGTGNLCGQEPCYEGPFDPPWLSAHDHGLEFRDPAGGTLTNDNRVLETEHHLIYSDASEDTAKIEMGRTAEDALTLIMGLFQVTPEELGIVDLYSKIGVYAMRRIGSGTRADRNGYINYAHDTHAGFVEPADIIHTAEHECTHTVQFRLGGAYAAVWCWFTEGLAEATGEEGVFPRIRCWPEAADFHDTAGTVNPVAVRVIEDMPGWDGDFTQTASLYYPMFGLAVRYLVDPRGWGKSHIDVKHMFSDMAAGMDFPQAFQTRMGMSLTFYEDHFWALMEAYLPTVCPEEQPTGGGW